MKLSSILFAVATLSTVVVAQGDKHLSEPHVDARGLNRHAHRQHAHAVRSVNSSSSSDSIVKRSTKKKRKSCVAKTTTTGTALPAETSASKSKTTTAANSKSSSSSSSNSSSSGGGDGKTINLTDAKCGSTGAVAKTTKTAGPNGSQDFLTCGVKTSGGWTPPMITKDNVIAMSYDEAIKDAKSPYHSCNKYKDAIMTAANKYGLPPILMFAFALQESSCNANSKGGGGEIGLFQVTKDKCSGVDCTNPAVNAEVAAKYVMNQLKSCNGNLLQMVGEYNGWVKGLTVAKATAARKSSCCRCQNNLDYPHQFFNGWLQNIDAYSTTLGTFQNLQMCPNPGANGRRMVKRSSFLATADEVEIPKSLNKMQRDEGLTGGWSF